MKRTIEDYIDIINLPHPVSVKHSQMSIHDRAAQFSPFAALTGHADAVKEMARQVSDKRELAEDAVADITAKLNFISHNIKNHPAVSVIYFVKDKTKEGGTYRTVSGNVIKLDNIAGEIYLDNKTIISMNHISSIEII